METTVIVASREVIFRQMMIAAGGIATGLGLVAMGALWWRDFHGALLGIAVALASVSTFVASFVRWAHPSRLTLEPDALVIEQALRGTRRIRWSDVESFYVDPGGRRDRAASWQQLMAALRPLASPLSGNVSYRLERALQLNSLALGSDSGFGRAEALPADDFQQSAMTLSTLLNDYRTRAIASSERRNDIVAVAGLRADTQA